MITVDDGHASFYHYAYPVFAKFDLPVTMYLTTGPWTVGGGSGLIAWHTRSSRRDGKR